MSGQFPYNNVYNPGWGGTMQYPQPTPSYSMTGPYQHQQPSAQAPQNNLLRVTGPESAKAYPVPPNSKVVLFDADNPVFYLKSTDDSGFATLKAFDFTERPMELPQVVQQPAASDDLASLKADVAELKEMLEGLVS